MDHMRVWWSREAERTVATPEKTERGRFELVAHSPGESPKFDVHQWNAPRRYCMTANKTRLAGTR